MKAIVQRLQINTVMSELYRMKGKDFLEEFGYTNEDVFMGCDCNGKLIYVKLDKLLDEYRELCLSNVVLRSEQLPCGDCENFREADGGRWFCSNCGTELKKKGN